MGKYNFSSTSRKRLGTCHPDLSRVMEAAIDVSDIDFGIAEGVRSVALQHEYYLRGKSKLDGVRNKSKHNIIPSLAVDIYAWVDGKTCYDKETLSYLAGLIHGISELFYSESIINHRVRWGGNWDMDGTILIDQSFDDRPHFELIKGKRT